MTRSSCRVVQSDQRKNLRLHSFSHDTFKNVDIWSQNVEINGGKAEKGKKEKDLIEIRDLDRKLKLTGKPWVTKSAANDFVFPLSKRVIFLNLHMHLNKRC